FRIFGEALVRADVRAALWTRSPVRMEHAGRRVRRTARVQLDDDRNQSSDAARRGGVSRRVFDSAAPRDYSPRIRLKNASLDTARPRNDSTIVRAEASLPRERIISRKRRPIAPFIRSAPTDSTSSSAITFAHM